MTPMQSSRNNNPLLRRIALGLETDGLTILKNTTTRSWLRQPVDSLWLFQEHKSKAMVHVSSSWKWQYDKNAAYLAAAGSVELGVGEPISVPGEQITEVHYNMPGLWRVYSYHTVSHPLNTWPSGESWQYTPIVRLMRELGYKHTVFQACLFPEHHTVLRRFYDYMKAWRERDREAAKECYTRLFGILAYHPEVLYNDMIYRPDWWYTIIAENNARILRTALRINDTTGLFPIGWNTDALYYEQRVNGFTLGNGIGQWKEIGKQ